MTISPERLLQLAEVVRKRFDELKWFCHNESLDGRCPQNHRIVSPTVRTSSRALMGRGGRKAVLSHTPSGLTVWYMSGWFSKWVEPRDGSGRAWYLKHLQDQRWKDKSTKIKERDDWTCRRDGEQCVPLHVHHLGYLSGRLPWEYPDDHLVTLCYNCHEVIHDFSEVPENMKWFFRLHKKECLVCYVCEAEITVEQASGRNGKNEPICESCCLMAEERRFK